MRQTVFEIIRQMEEDDRFGNTQISEYVNFSLRETLEKIDAYLNSKHTSGETDSLGREKPFFNIVTAAVNVWMRATDLDRKNVRVKATKADDYILAFLATIHLQQWMRKSNFGKWLNDWGRTLARYGSAVSKFVEKDGEFHAEVIPWNRLLVDPVNFETNVKVEKLWFTPAQLRRKKNYNQKFVEELIRNTSTRRTNDGQQVDNKSNYILIYEVHGELPASLLNKDDEIIDEKDDEFVQQIHVVSYQAGKGGTTNSYNDFTLYSGREARDPYHLAHLIEEEGRTLAIGAVEHLFEAQWMVNHSQKQIKDQLDLASKLLFQTADGNFVGQNALTNIENGDILIHGPNMPLTQLSNRPDIAAMQSSGAEWRAQGNIINGIGEAMLGAAPKAGTAWRQTEAILAESHSLFEQMTENKGIALEEILREFVIPYVKKQMDTSEEISATLEEHQIEQIDMMYVPNEAKRRANQIIKDTILSGQIYDPAQQTGEIANQEEILRKALAPLGSQRFIKPSDIETTTWKETLKDLEWDLEVDVTSEAKDTQASMATLSTVFQTLVGNPMALQDPNVKLVFGRILEMTGGISPVELKTASAQPAMAGAPMAAMGNQQAIQ